MRTNTWTNIGTNVEQCTSMEHVLETSRLNYTIEKRPVLTRTADGSEIIIPNRFVTCRKEDGHIYDVVSDKFEIIQNRDAFDFVNYMGDELIYEKAGETENGMVYIIARLPEVKILGDSFTPHVIFRNGFTGKVQITAAICPLRVVCQNQFNFAFRNAENTVQVRHVQNAEHKLEEAREVLKLSADYMGELNSVAERLATKKMSQLEVNKVTDLLFPLPTEDMNPFRRHTLENARSAFLAAYEEEDNRNFRGSAWGIVNAYTDYITHKEAQGKTSTKEEGKFVRTTFGKSMNNVLEVLDWRAA